ncbi:hypothetical protein D0Z07_7846 [Hyphodiscus hymeniophilus]|uniref:Uncharacterized protein n=1 Tax=Hyphodiscus hymeniophilus TaxID=353542 RepID=A0A9P6SL80_9HELO|nr:hypothetical protein D0Z07_7846 [Hyphodiscus hymeniophilus]
MLLQKTSYRIKQFISHQRSTITEYAEKSDDKDFSALKPQIGNPNGLSWAPQISAKEIRQPHRAVTRSSTFNLLEALTLDPIDCDRTPTQSTIITEQSDMDSLEDNAEKLIRETDEAFQAVGNALADARTVTQGWRQDADPEPVARHIPEPRGAARKASKPFAMTRTYSVSRTQSAAKGKRKGFRRKKKLLSQIRNVSQPSANAQARWTLTDITANVVDIFSGIMFKVEADEMLTPDRLHRLRQEERREIDRRLKQGEKMENERRVSIESARSIGTDGSNSTDPFHLESLSSRLIIAALNDPITPSSPSPVSPHPMMPRLQKRSSSARKDPRDIESTTNPNDSEMDLQDLKFPSPPRFYRSKSRSTPPLPTIPEVSPLSFVAPKAHYARYMDRRFSFESMQPPPGYILLPSTSFTMTCPLFEQGPIRIERKEKELLPDEVLDWTAFQMAISGTMDEIGVDERDDIEWAADEAEVDGILDWWNEYKFPGDDQTIQGGHRRRRR